MEAGADGIAVISWILGWLVKGLDALMIDFRTHPGPTSFHDMK
jgi:hypothetical protein